MSVMHLLGGTATMPSPHARVPDVADTSLVEGALSECKISATDELTPLPATPPVSTANSESFLKPPSFPSIQEPSTPRPSSSSTRRVLFQELLSSQFEIDDVPDDGFFLAAPKDVFAKPMDSTISPTVVRPRAHRISQGQHEEALSVAGALSLSSFRTIDEEPINGRVHNQESSALETPQVRLKPRPASFQDGQRAWESMSTFSSVYGSVGAELLE